MVVNIIDILIAKSKYSNFLQYRNLIVTVLSLLHPNGDLSGFRDAADGIISLERQLSEVCQSLQQVYS